MSTNAREGTSDRPPPGTDDREGSPSLLPSEPPPGLSREQADQVAGRLRMSWEDMADDQFESDGSVPALVPDAADTVQTEPLSATEAAERTGSSAVGAKPPSTSRKGVLWVGVVAVLACAALVYFLTWATPVSQEPAVSPELAEATTPADEPVAREAEDDRRATTASAAHDPAAPVATKEAVPSEAVPSPTSTPGEPDRPGPPPAKPEPKPSTRPATSSGVQPAAQKRPTPPPSRTVRVRIRTIPPNARLSMDGTRVSNPFEAQLTRSNRTHVLSASASGYHSASTRIRLNADQSHTLRLRRRARPRRTRAKARSTSRPSGSGFVTDNPY